jgi:hypothetical protein
VRSCGWEIVQDHYVALLQCRSELGLDIGVEAFAVQGVVDDPRCGQAIAPQSGDEGLGGPVSERRIGFQADAPAGPPPQTGHLGRRAGFVEEDQPVDPLAQARLTMRLPLVTRLAHVLALNLRSQQCFF